MASVRKRWSRTRALAVPLAIALIATACGGDDDGGGVADDGEQAAASDDDGEDDGAGDGDDDGAAAPEELTTLEMVVFSPPSLGAFLPAIIEDQGFDEAHGIDLQFVERPPDAYNTEFASGQFELGGSGSLMSEANRVAQGVDVAYLFNVHDYWAAVVSTDDEVTELTDLDGRDLAGVTSSTSYAMFRWFAQEQGLDLSNVDVQNFQTAGLGTQAQTGRSTAVQLWEPGYSNLMAQVPDLIDLDLGLENWEDRFGFSDIPYLGVAAHRSWIEEHEDLIPDLQAVYEDAAEWALANPEEAAEIIAATMEGADAAPIADLLANNDRLGLNVQSAADIADAIRAVFEAGVETGYFEEVPSDDAIYGAGS